MKILHTSDWHIGRTFLTHPTLEHFGVVVGGMVEVVREQGIDVVLVAGDVFDSAVPSAEAYRVLSESLRRLRATGARVILTSGNHDSATRLGFQAEWAREAGVHVLTSHDELHEPVVVDDEHGPVLFYGIPFLEPTMIRHAYPSVELRTHEQALGFAMGRVRADLAARGAAVSGGAGAGGGVAGDSNASGGGAASGALRSVVLAHCFAVGVAASDVERDISSGGLDLVPLGVFDGPDYVALGHIHGRSQLSERVRYSGAPLHYSFSEADKPRGGWVVTLDAAGLADVQWVSFPVPRALSEVTGTLDELLADPRFTPFEQNWVKAIVTDQQRPLDGMRRLQVRYPFCIDLQHRPAVRADAGDQTYAERVAAKSDREIVGDFIGFVRNGVAPTAFELSLVASLLGERDAKESV